MAMGESSISDQKRAARGLHWKTAQKYLRARDKTHHHPWRMLTIAGPAPHEEINCIRSLFRGVHITSVDKDPRCVEAAIDSGADEVFVLDVGDFEECEYAYSTRYLPPAELGKEKFDAICLDLSCPVNDRLKRVVSVYFHEALTTGGILMVTFSYGRDVVEMYEYEWEKEETRRSKKRWHDGMSIEDHLAELPDKLMRRVWYMLRSMSRNLVSCVQYIGGEMPMCSCLLLKRQGFSRPTAFLALADGDYEQLIADDDPANVFACSKERVLELRAQNNRRLAARKAVQTRRLRAAKQPQLQLVRSRGTRLQVIELPKQPKLRMIEPTLPREPTLSEKLRAIKALPVPINDEQSRIKQARVSEWQRGPHIDSMPTQRSAEEILGRRAQPRAEQGSVSDNGNDSPPGIRGIDNLWKS